MDEFQEALCRVIQGAGGWHSAKVPAALKLCAVSDIEISGYQSVTVDNTIVTRQEYRAWEEKQSSKS